LKSLDSSLKLSKEKEVLVQDGIQQLRHQLSQVESEKSMVEEQYQALQRLHMQLEAQERENEAKSLQQLKEVGQERLRTMDAIRQAEQLQRKKDILEEELAERNQYWENRWSSYSSKVADDERKWKDTQGSLGRELRQAKDDLSVSDEKLRQHDRELQKAINDVRMLRQEVLPCVDSHFVFSPYCYFYVRSNRWNIVGRYDIKSVAGTCSKGTVECRDGVCRRESQVARLRSTVA
jgi:chromosome segregation ATPase